MGTFGTAISSNDTYADIYSDFFDLYNNGFAVKEISEKLIAINQDTINDADDSNNFWFALAKAQWECKQLDKQLLDRVKKIIETGTDIELWRQLGAGEKDINKRKLALDKFLSGLKTERPKAKQRKKKTIRQPVFEKGDCLTFKLANGNYGGAVVLEAIKNSEHGHNLIAVTRINQVNKPNKKDFETADVLVLNFGNWVNDPRVTWCLPIRNKNIKHLIDKVDTIEVQLDYTTKNSMFGFISDLDIWVIGVANRQFKFEETNQPPIVKQTIKELAKKSK